MARKEHETKAGPVADEQPAEQLPAAVQPAEQPAAAVEQPAAADPPEQPEQPAAAYVVGTMYDVELSGSLHWRQRRYQPGDKLRLDGEALNQPEVAALVKSATESRARRPAIPRKSRGEM